MAKQTAKRKGPTKQSVEEAGQVWCDPTIRHRATDMKMVAAIARKLDEIKAKVRDDPTYDRWGGGVFEIYTRRGQRGTGDVTRWRLKNAKNGKTVCSGEGHPSIALAKRATARVRRLARTAKMSIKVLP